MVMEVGTRRIVHFNITAHPTADWTRQQFRAIITGEKPHRLLIHDRDSIYSFELDSAVRSMGLSILKTPFRAPQANAFCERLIGSIRRECLDFLIPLNERHLRGILKEWVAHYNRGRPHSSLGPGIPEPSGGIPTAPISGYAIPCNHRVVKKPCSERSASRIPTGEGSMKKWAEIQKGEIVCGAQPVKSKNWDMRQRICPGACRERSARTFVFQRDKRATGAPDSGSVRAVT